MELISLIIIFILALFPLHKLLKHMQLNEILNIKYPVILAPMFLVTNVKMVEAAIDAGATGALVAHNYRNSNDH